LTQFLATISRLVVISPLVDVKYCHFDVHIKF